MRRTTKTSESRTRGLAVSFKRWEELFDVPNESSRHASQLDGSPEQTASFLPTGSIAHKVVFGPVRVLSRRRIAPLLSTPAESIADSPSVFVKMGCICEATGCCGGSSHMHPPRALHTPQSGSMIGLTSSGSSTQRHSLDDWQKPQRSMWPVPGVCEWRWVWLREGGEEDEPGFWHGQSGSGSGQMGQAATARFGPELRRTGWERVGRGGSMTIDGRCWGGE